MEISVSHMWAFLLQAVQQIYVFLLLFFRILSPLTWSVELLLRVCRNLTLASLTMTECCLCCKAGLAVRVAQVESVQSHVVLLSTGQRSASGFAFSTSRELRPVTSSVVLDSELRFV